MKRFKKIYIEITNICNLSCDFCPKTSRTKKYMSEEEFNTVLGAVGSYTDHIYLHLMGEPFLHPELGRFLEISAENNLKVNVTTNGTLIGSVAEILLKSTALRQVNFSLSSFEANSAGESLEHYVHRIIEFAERASRETNIICSIRLWNLDSDVLKGMNKENDEIFRQLERELDLEFSIKELLGERKSANLGRNLYLNMAEKFSWPDITEEEKQDRVFCYGLRDHIGVHVDGTVVPCCLDSEGHVSIGNIFHHSLENILNSDRAKNLFEGFSRRIAVEDLCKKCGYAARY